MKFCLKLFFASVFRAALWFRYRIKVKGLDRLDLSKERGALFLPNHPTMFVDPILLAILPFPKYQVRPVVVEYMYYAPVLNWFMRLIEAVPVPHFAESSNSLKRKKSEWVIRQVAQGLYQKKNYLLYPAGKVKLSEHEVIDGTSGLHQILSEMPDANVVLVRVKGLWGSSFSTAQTGFVPPMFPTLARGIKAAFKNLLFFSPRRDVIIEFEKVPADFLSKLSRQELNRHLEQWYNKPDGLSKQAGEFPGDSLVVVPYSRWSKKLPVFKKNDEKKNSVDLAIIDEEIKQKVLKNLADVSGKDQASIKPDMLLSQNLGMDSLNIAEVVAFLQEEFDLDNLVVQEGMTVKDVLGLASKQINWEIKDQFNEDKLQKWKKPLPSTLAEATLGTTLVEAFLKSAEKRKNACASADQISGVLTYQDLKLRTVLLAGYIKKLSGKHIGILLPASVAAEVAVFACQLAGKVPVMINWTVGPKHLKSVVQQTKLEVVLSSWSFLDKLQNVDLEGVEDQLLLLEDIRHQLSIKDKFKAFLLSKQGAKRVLKAFDADKISEDSPAVILFTSGTENHPKGVPLSHRNILTNIKSASRVLQVYENDVIYSILPPFHSFGFTIGIFFAPLHGVRVAYFPNPTEGRRLAKAFERFEITAMFAAPTFLKGMIQGGSKETFKTLRVCVSGAEKAPPELVEALKKIGKESCFLEGYGITECAPVLTVNRLNQEAKGVGLPIPEVELCIVHIDSHHVLALGEQGLILARGPNIFSGYLNGESSPFLEVNGKRWYNTGDLGFLDEKGRLTITGRLKRFVKVGGEMISLASLEDAVRQMLLKRGITVDDGPGIAIVAKELPGEKPRIYVFSKLDVTVDDLNKHLKEAGFSNLAKVSDVKHLLEIPLMGTGKINYRALEMMID